MKHTSEQYKKEHALFISKNFIHPISEPHYSQDCVPIDI